MIVCYIEHHSVIMKKRKTTVHVMLQALNKYKYELQPLRMERV